MKVDFFDLLIFMIYFATVSRTSATSVQLGGLLQFAPAGIRRKFKSLTCRRKCIGVGPRVAGVVAKAIASGRGAIGWLGGAHRSPIEKEIEEP